MTAPHAMRRILSIVSSMALLVGCQKQSAPTTTEPANMTQEQVARLFMQEKDKADAWFTALDAAKPSAPLLIEFVRLFPDAVVNYRYFGGDDGPGFDVSVDLYERYELTMQLPVHFAPSGDAVVGYGEPKFYLHEVASQKGRQTSYRSAGQRHFGSDEWRRVVESGGDFGAIGYKMITNQPVAGFKDRKVE